MSNLYWAMDEDADDGVTVEWEETLADPVFYKWIEWVCPVCGEKNIDSPDLTAVPICGDCERVSDWEEFVGLFD